MADLLTCALCGHGFEPSTAGCPACPLHAGCTMVCCPACGYSTIDPARSGTWQALLQVRAWLRDRRPAREKTSTGESG